MITLHFAPRTRAVRVLWLLEELGVEYRLERVEFAPQAATFSQQTPLGKLPVLEDGDVCLAESGAILEHLLDRYDPQHQFSPPLGSAARPRYLMWLHYAEGTAYAPLGTLIRHRLYLRDAESVPTVIEDAVARAHAVLDFVEAQANEPYLCGAQFTAADVMMSFTLLVAQAMGVLDDGRYPRLARLLARVQARPAFAKAASA